MASPDMVKGLPTHLALDVLSVLTDVRPGASRFLDAQYYTNQLRALDPLDGGGAVGRRSKLLRESRDLWETVSVDFDSFSESALHEATRKLTGIVRELPEVNFLRNNYPGTVLAVPEWIRTDNGINYGVRVHFRPAGDPLAARELTETNIDAVAEDDMPAYRDYLGELHGYPDCCMAAFRAHSDADRAPEWRSIAPYESCVNDEQLGLSASASVDDLLDGFLDRPGAYGFFAREFFPHPGCDTAAGLGVEIYDALAERLPDPLVRDYFRLNFLHAYVLTKSLLRNDGSRPEAGALGTEHRYFSLPLAPTLALSRYATTNSDG